MQPITSMRRHYIFKYLVKENLLIPNRVPAVHCNFVIVVVSNITYVLCYDFGTCGALKYTRRKRQNV